MFLMYKTLVPVVGSQGCHIGYITSEMECYQIIHARPFGLWSLWGWNRDPGGLKLCDTGLERRHSTALWLT